MEEKGNKMLQQVASTLPASFCSIGLLGSRSFNFLLCAIPTFLRFSGRINARGWGSADLSSSFALLGLECIGDLPSADTGGLECLSEPLS